MRFFLRNTTRLFIIMLCIAAASYIICREAKAVLPEEAVVPEAVTVKTRGPLTEEQKNQINSLLKTEEDIQYYAYLSISETDKQMEYAILAAREKIIGRYSWVADDIDGFILDKNGNFKKRVPTFHELFPSDWDPPVYPVESVGLDLEYYGIS